MKTIMYYDRGDANKTLYGVKLSWLQKKNDRIIQGMKELEHVGNIVIYLVRGRKFRKIATRGL